MQLVATPTFSIIIPTHNGANYIGSAIESVLAQTYPHFSLVVLEHRSTDDTVAIVESYAAVDERVSIVSSDIPNDIIENWACILELELQPYMTILGHDDILYPDFLRQIVDAIAEYPTASVYTTRFDFVNDEGQSIRSSHQCPVFETAEQFMQHQHRLKRDVRGLGFVVRSTDYKKIGGLQPFAGLMYADEYAWYQLSIPGGKVCLPERQYAFRIHESSAGHTVQLTRLYTAARQYLTALESSPYYGRLENRELARNYASYRFICQYHTKLFNLGWFGTDDDWMAYETEITRIFSDAQQHNLFVVYDRLAWLYEKVGRIKYRFVRFPLLYTLKTIQVVRQYIREWHGINA
ncbi:glycosyltransferase family 2 protein [Chloroflexota bacterium]